jgi:hypothetical protein
MYIRYKMTHKERQIYEDIEDHLRKIAKLLKDDKIDEFLTKLDIVRKQAKKDLSHL